MKSTPWGMAAVLCLIAAIVAACATVDRTSSSSLAAGPLKGQKGQCQWTYELGVDTKKIDKKSLTTTSDSLAKGCTVHHFDPPLYIGNDSKKGMKVVDMGAVEVDVEGSCLYCYINAAGGMSCVRYC
jgi:hypothetical protein